MARIGKVGKAVGKSVSKSVNKGLSRGIKYQKSKKAGAVSGLMQANRGGIARAGSGNPNVKYLAPGSKAAKKAGHPWMGANKYGKKTVSGSAYSPKAQRGQRAMGTKASIEGGRARRAAAPGGARRNGALPITVKKTKINGRTAVAASVSGSKYSRGIAATRKGKAGVKVKTAKTTLKQYKGPKKARSMGRINLNKLPAASVSSKGVAKVGGKTFYAGKSTKVRKATKMGAVKNRVSRVQSRVQYEHAMNGATKGGAAGRVVGKAKKAVNSRRLTGAQKKAYKAYKPGPPLKKATTRRKTR